MNIKTKAVTITQHRTNEKVVRTAEHVSSRQVEVTYADGSKEQMSVDVFKMMHKVVEQ